MQRINFIRIIYLASSFLLFCSSSNSNNIKNKPNESFIFSNYKIKKHSIGPITIGMSLKVAESKIYGLKKRYKPAYEFGVDSEKKVPCYYLNNSPVFALITKDRSDKIFLIAAVHKNLRTTTGLSPQSSVSELIQKYPNFLVSYNLLNNNEDFTDKTNNWDFVFDTNDNNQIGSYSHDSILEPSKPQRFDVRSNYLIIW